jgi:predicted TIM-barrel fold metal-dependent hydrolase
VIVKEETMSKYYGDWEITDAHVHPRGGVGLEEFLKAAKRFIDDADIKGVNLLCSNMMRVNSAGMDLLSLALKVKDPRYTVYGSFTYWPKTIPNDGPGLKAQLETIMNIGFDGLKMIEGKPTTRAATGIPLDDPRYDPPCDILEKTGFHILNHVNDPEEFWDEKLVPQWSSSASQGGYWDASKYLSKEQHYIENENLLARHPKMNVTFAHAYFLSNFPDRMVALLDKYPSVTIDLCPGIEMFDGFTKQYKRWREIFVAYQDRFLFGTDNRVTIENPPPPTHDGDTRYKIANVTRYVTTADDFEAWGYKLKGFGLPKEASEKILSGNYLRLRGAPKKVNKDAAIAYGEALLKEVNSRNDVGEGQKKDINDALNFFKAL